jgi:hypothetical protein
VFSSQPPNGGANAYGIEIRWKTTAAGILSRPTSTALPGQSTKPSSFSSNTSSPNSNLQTSPPSSNQLSKGAKVGITVSVLVVFFIVAGGLVYFLRRRRQQRRQKATDQQKPYEKPELDASPSVKLPTEIRRKPISEPQVSELEGVERSSSDHLSAGRGGSMRNGTDMSPSELLAAFTEPETHHPSSLEAVSHLDPIRESLVHSIPRNNGTSSDPPVSPTVKRDAI